MKAPWLVSGAQRKVTTTPSKMIVESAVKTGQVGGSNAIFDIAFFVFIAFLASIEAFLTFPRCRLIVESFWDPVLFAQSIRIWFGQRRRKPPNKFWFPFRGTASRRLIVAFINGSKARDPGESPLNPSKAARLGIIATSKRKQFCDYSRERFQQLNGQRELSAIKEPSVSLRLMQGMQ